MTGALTITAEDLDRIVRETAARLLAEKIAAVPVKDLATSLDWMPAEWFARQWNRETETVHGLLKKLRVRVNAVSQKTKLYSIADVNQKIEDRAALPKARRRARIVPFPPQAAS